MIILYKPIFLVFCLIMFYISMIIRQTKVMRKEQIKNMNEYVENSEIQAKNESIKRQDEERQMEYERNQNENEKSSEKRIQQSDRERKERQKQLQALAQAEEMKRLNNKYNSEADYSKDHSHDKDYEKFIIKTQHGKIEDNKQGHGARAEQPYKPKETIEREEQRIKQNEMDRQKKQLDDLRQANEQIRRIKAEQDHRQENEEKKSQNSVKREEPRPQSQELRDLANVQSGFESLIHAKGSSDRLCTEAIERYDTLKVKVENLNKLDKLIEKTNDKNLREKYISNKVSLETDIERDYGIKREKPKFFHSKDKKQQLDESYREKLQVKLQDLEKSKEQAVKTLADNKGIFKEYVNDLRSKGNQMERSQELVQTHSRSR